MDTPNLIDMQEVPGSSPVSPTSITRKSCSNIWEKQGLLQQPYSNPKKKTDGENRPRFHFVAYLRPLGQDRIHCPGGFIHHGRQDMRVYVHRGPEAAVAKELLNYLRMDSSQEQESGARMAQVVKTYPGQACFLQNGVEGPIPDI
jgi:hypothetical protein